MGAATTVCTAWPRKTTPNCNGTSDYGFGRSFQCAQELWAGLSRELGSGRTRVEELGSRLGRSRRLPILKRFPSKSAERIAGNEMALDVERVLDCGMNGQEPLC